LWPIKNIYIDKMRMQIAFLLLATQLCFGFDLATYKQQYQTQVGAPYKNAVTIAATNIIEFLATAPVPTTADAGKQVATNLNAQAQTFSTNLGTAAQSSDTLRQQLDHEVETLVAQASGVQQQIAANEQQLQQTNAQIQQTNAQLADAQNQVNAAQKSVQDAENALHSEEDRVNKASHHCTKIGGWLGHKICQVVNHDGINHAKDARGHAQADLAGRQQRLAQFQGQLAQLNQQQANLQQARANLEASKAQLNAQLTQLNQARDNVNNVDVGLKAVIAHVGTLLGKSQVLVDVVKNLIDMETVITPLTAIADQIITYSASADDINYLNAMKQKISTNLPLVQQKLPQYALIPQ